MVLRRSRVDIAIAAEFISSSLLYSLIGYCFRTERGMDSRQSLLAELSNEYSTLDVARFSSPSSSNSAEYSPMHS